MHSEFEIFVQATARVETDHDRTLLNLNSEALYREMLKKVLREKIKRKSGSFLNRYTAMAKKFHLSAG